MRNHSAHTVCPFSMNSDPIITDSISSEKKRNMIWNRKMISSKQRNIKSEITVATTILAWH